MIEDTETAAALESIKEMNAQILSDLDTLKISDFDTEAIEEIRQRQMELLFDLEAIVKNERSTVE